MEAAAVGVLRTALRSVPPSAHALPDLFVLTLPGEAWAFAAVSIAALPATGDWRVGRWAALNTLPPIMWDSENPGRL
ncbi:hypothetical protein GCM10010123_40420 [Pilimelia anulata]|uniref:Uncharacterized protein n=2 Tax=Pilimelia anulata TaxID=53371 RepID=A0A8J3FFU1_9ACTN|nr:hypothetical protein GCM10010123_40420 [Pilimelia anulata]